MSKKLSEKLRKYPLWLQCATLNTLMMTLVVLILITNNYTHNTENAIRDHITNTTQILELEMDTINQYVKDLTAFCIQPCFDSKFTRIIESKTETSEDDRDYIKSQMKEYFYTRSDLNSYNIYLSNDNSKTGRNTGDQHIVYTKYNSLSPEDEYAFSKCANSKYFLTITEPATPGDFFVFYHSIIQIKNKASLAYVKCEVKKEFINSLVKNYSPNEGEILLLLNEDSKLLFSSSDEFTPDDLISSLDAALKNGVDEDSIITLNNHQYLYTNANNSSFGLSLISLQPYSIITNKERQMFIDCLIQGIVIWLLFSILIITLCRLLMRPLNELAGKIKQVGEGDFSYRATLSGSSEVANLCDSYNYMSEHIQTLIHENYITKLSEQSAKLIALEAQINPHFLYNTLQAISTEALINDQLQIHEMVISLAAILRYSIKGGDLVRLSDEMDHVRKYIYLNKIRMDENLKTIIDIEPKADKLIIPKISIHTLVENSIVHGINGEITSIQINISVKISGNKLYIIVRDNGAGISSEDLAALYKSFNEDALCSTQTKGVGLANLYGRLRILFNSDADMEVTSTPGCGTQVTITLPVKEDLNDKSINS